MTEAKTFVRDLIARNKATYDEDRIRDVIDAYVKERNLRESRGDPTAKYFTGKTTFHLDQLDTSSHRCDLILQKLLLTLFFK